MAVLSDLLGIPHFTTSRGSTVRRDFLQAAAVALGVPVATVQGMATKDDVLALVVQTATDAPMDPDLVSVGGTVTNQALQTIVDAVTRYGVPGRLVVPATEVNDVVGEDAADLLASCHTQSLRVADELGARTVAFPAISTGVYGYPVDEAAPVAVEAVRSATTQVELVRFVLFGAEAFDAFRNAAG